MTLYQFELLSSEVQLRYVFSEGTFLAQRTAPHGLISLYHLADGSRGFFVEVTYEQHELELFVLRCFRSSGPLEAYGQGVEWPEG